MSSFISQLLGRQKPRRPRLTMPDDFVAIYAIGDVHGRYDLLTMLERTIVGESARFHGPKLLVMLGDYVDRGPQSAEVIEHLMAPPPEGFIRICLAGNHEEVMGEFLRHPQANTDWLEFGGTETLRSYGIAPQDLEDALRSTPRLRKLLAAVPQSHRDFIEGLGGMLVLPGLTFVHAGIRPGVMIEEQEDSDLLWIRYDFIDSDEDFGTVVVHGHTPVIAAEIRANRIAIDTGAFATGILSGVALRPGPPRIIEARIARY
jgi:serine/threonine protein phosphatase 1